jgi:hypothetical protein
MDAGIKRGRRACSPSMWIVGSVRILRALEAKQSAKGAITN